MKNISYWFHKRAQISPKRIAVTSIEKQWTYVEANERILQMTVLLKEKYQIHKGDRVAILSQNCPEYIWFLGAISRLEAIAVPLNIRLTAKELAFQLQDSEAKLILFEEEFVHTVKEIQLEVSIESAYLPVDKELLNMKKTGMMDEFNDGAIPYIICYTSGTTGRPKGAVLTQENMFWNAVNNQLALDITSNDRTIVLLPLFHIGGIGLFAFPVFFSGGTVVIPGKFDPEVALRVIEEQKVTIVMGVPTILDAIRKSASFATTDFSSVRWFYNGGAPCPKELLDDYLASNLPIGQGFGMTETSPTVFMISKEDYRRKPGSIGKPVLFCDIRIVDENGEDVSQGEVGELIIRGPNVMLEYWCLEEATKETIRDGWLYSGDLVRQDDEGFVYVSGRKKDMIISGGENIYPLEIELALKELPEIDEVALVGKPDELWGEVPIAYIVWNKNKQLSYEALTSYCLKRLGKYKIPKQFFELDELPKNATGKLMKTKLLTIGDKAMEIK
ncbi:MAG TPA: o-succinylbenzoate--CoA ligase [Bacilli bacterium]|nr:o-succinylbenzoate--CoA ligase [Bacilli bacterium]